MENAELRKQFNAAKDSFIEKIKKNKKCLAAYLFGSTSHDLIFEWSDLQIFLIFEDGYKWTSRNLIEHGIDINVCVFTKSKFLEWIISADIEDWNFRGLSKSTPLFVKDPIIKENVDDIFYIGDRDREAEMLEGFSQTIYAMNKAEKNFYVKENMDNAIHFLLMAAAGIAWIEVAKQRLFPEREIMTQAKALNPEFFHKIYFRMLYEVVTEQMIDDILKINKNYMKENTREVYRSVLDYLKKHGNLDRFTMPTARGSVDLTWLYRMGILEKEIIPTRIASQADEFFTYRYIAGEGRCV
ncbi:MAG: nucleotidyltransferase domain-containing protein [Defluviitaleaceae bacterium]|nr:nucleotidyltransferase domain-containing protein [Defluviitaleaceae bacterium]